MAYTSVKESDLQRLDEKLEELIFNCRGDHDDEEIHKIAPLCVRAPARPLAPGVRDQRRPRVRAGTRER